jgi:probable HAF family extracellular repeat protein
MHMQRPHAGRRAALAASFAVLATATAALAAAASNHAPSTYAIKSLDAIGGSSAGAFSIDDAGWIAGVSSVGGNTAQHAALWWHGVAFDLGTLGGTNSAVDWPVNNVNGELVGNAETATADPLGENFCRYGTGLECNGFVWHDGAMQALAPLPGGNNSYAAGENDRYQAVGWAEDGTVDATCFAPQALQYEPVIWDLSTGHTTTLAPLPEDPDGAAVAANDRGDVVGISGPCADADGEGAAHAVLWQNGQTIDLGNFGGTILNTADAINENGEIAGFSTVTGNATFHAFVWTKQRGIRDLGTLPGDVLSEATGINAAGQIVGGSCDINNNCRAFLWQHGRMYDMNALAPHAAMYLTFAGDINDRGEIVGLAYDPRSGTTPAFAATPRGARGATLRAAERVMLPERVRRTLRERVLWRIGPGGRSERGQ